MHTPTPRPGWRSWSTPTDVSCTTLSPANSHLQPIRKAVYTVTDSPCVHAALLRVRECDGTEVVAFGSALAFLKYVRTDESSCLILDLHPSDGKDLDLQCQLAAEACPPVIFICGHSDICSAVRAMKAGAIEVLTMPVDPSALVEAIHVAIAQDGRLRKKSAELVELTDRLALLTPREREVLPLIVGGLLNKQAAGVLGISDVTLQIHRSQVMRKMRAESLADLVRMAAKLRVPFWCDKKVEKKTPLELVAFTKRQSPRTLMQRVVSPPAFLEKGQGQRSSLHTALSGANQFTIERMTISSR